MDGIEPHAHARVIWLAAALLLLVSSVLPASAEPWSCNAFLQLSRTDPRGAWDYAADFYDAEISKGDVVTPVGSSSYFGVLLKFCREHPDARTNQPVRR
jgi:hypothetical protein